MTGLAPLCFCNRTDLENAPLHPACCRAGRVYDMRTAEAGPSNTHLVPCLMYVEQQMICFCKALPDLPSAGTLRLSHSDTDVNPAVLLIAKVAVSDSAAWVVACAPVLEGATQRTPSTQQNASLGSRLQLSPNASLGCVICFGF